MKKMTNAHISNFRSCLKTDLQFKENLTALIGLNGEGKTNILCAVHSLSKIDTYRHRHHTAKILDGNPHSTIEVKLDLDDVVVDVRAEIYFDLGDHPEHVNYSEISFKTSRLKEWLPIETFLVEYSDFFDREDFDGFLKRVTRREIGQKEIKHLDLKKAIIKYLHSISYYSATHFSDPSNSPVSLELENGDYARRYNHSRHEKFIKDLHQAHKQGAPFEKFLNFVGPRGLSLVQDIDFKEYSAPSSTYMVQVGGDLKTVERDKTVLVPSVTIDNLRLSFNQLSEGTFKTLALVFYILNDKNDLLIIEEPEVCVHHGLLSSLIELIKVQSKTKQIIISTHSDYVLDMLKPDNILLVKKDKDKGTKALTLEEEMYAEQYTFLKEYLASTGGLGEYWKESGF